MQTQCGIDRLSEFPHVFSGKRLGLVTGGSGMGRDYRSSIEILKEHYHVTTLFSPEHGVRGELQGGVLVKTHIDAHSGLPAYSLFSDEINTTLVSARDALYMPSQEALDRVDAIVFDIQDVGSRYYTYPSTLYYVMKACAHAGKECIVLDRPNPIGGGVEGNRHREENLSFIGLTRVPIRHGMTLGELALFYNGEYGLGCSLSIVPVSGWNRDMFFNETGLPFVCPSPNLPSLESIVLYNGTCMFAGTNVSDGRGTTKPFEMLGAPYMDPFKTVDALEALGLQGVRFSVVYFVPVFFKYAGEVCPGVRIHVTDQKAVRPVELGVRVMRALEHLYPNDFAYTEPAHGARYHIDIESGTSELREGKLSADAILEGWAREAEAFLPVRDRYSLYRSPMSGKEERA